MTGICRLERAAGGNGPDGVALRPPWVADVDGRRLLTRHPCQLLESTPTFHSADCPRPGTDPVAKPGEKGSLKTWGITTFIVRALMMSPVCR